MTATDPLALLAELEQAHAAATPGEWVQHPADPSYVIGQVSDGGESYLDVADAAGSGRPGGWQEAEADAAAIVAEHNALPRLTAAVRAALALADEWERGATRWETPLPVPPEVAQLRATVTAALTGEES